MGTKNNKIIINYDNNLGEKLEKLKKIYNINTKSKLIEHIVDLELRRFNI